MKGTALFAVLSAALLSAVSLPVLAQTPVDGQFTYQGELRLLGNPVDGAADFRFTLWNAATGGDQVGTAVQTDAVTVVEGRFTVGLDFGTSALNGEKRWLEIEVRSPAGEGTFSTLDPRQPITPSPYAIQTRGIFVDDNNNVGIGTTTPERDLDIEATDAVLRLTSTDESPTTKSQIQLKSSGTAVFQPFGSIGFYDANDALRAEVSGNASGGSAAQISMTVQPGELPHLRVTSGFVQARERLQVARSVDGSPSAVIRSDGADSELQIHGGRVVIGDLANAHVTIDNNDIIAHDGDQWATLRINANGGPITMGQYDIRPALAYGHVNIAGPSLRGHSENVLGVARIGGGNYELWVQGGLDPLTDIVICTGENPRSIYANYIDHDSGTLRVSVWDAFQEEFVGSNFSFVVYRP